MARPRGRDDMGPDQGRDPCPDCHGWGVVPSLNPEHAGARCPWCDGTGRVNREPHPCKLPDGTIDHDWEMRTDWDGDPNVINGTRTWQTPVCRRCGIEQQELGE